jgi:hypothetical protein
MSVLEAKALVADKSRPAPDLKAIPRSAWA